MSRNHSKQEVRIHEMERLSSAPWTALWKPVRIPSPGAIEGTGHDRRISSRAAAPPGRTFARPRVKLSRAAASPSLRPTTPPIPLSWRSRARRCPCSPTGWGSSDCRLSRPSSAASRSGNAFSSTSSGASSESERAKPSRPNSLTAESSIHRPRTCPNRTHPAGKATHRTNASSTILQPTVRILGSPLLARQTANLPPYCRARITAEERPCAILGAITVVAAPSESAVARAISCHSPSSPISKVTPTSR